jgi:hypothetical protein
METRCGWVRSAADDLKTCRDAPTSQRRAILPSWDRPGCFYPRSGSKAWRAPPRYQVTRMFLWLSSWSIRSGVWIMPCSGGIISGMRTMLATCRFRFPQPFWGKRPILPSFPASVPPPPPSDQAAGPIHNPLQDLIVLTILACLTKKSILQSNDPFWQSLVECQPCCSNYAPRN